jgi:hypothetical protein
VLAVAAIGSPETIFTCKEERIKVSVSDQDILKEKFKLVTITVLANPAKIHGYEEQNILFQIGILIQKSVYSDVRSITNIFIWSQFVTAELDSN